MKATEQYFPVLLCIKLYKVALTFESLGEILKCDHLKWNLSSYTFTWYCLVFDIFFKMKIWQFSWTLIWAVLGLGVKGGNALKFRRSKKTKKEMV